MTGSIDPIPRKQAKSLDDQSMSSSTTYASTNNNLLTSSVTSNGTSKASPRISHSSNPGDDWVRLNVGGTIFITTKSTLLNYSSVDVHFLARMILNDQEHNRRLPSLKDETAAYLVDRNPDYFKHVINFLRNGRLDIPNNHILDGVLSEAEFCNLKPLIQLCKERIAERENQLEKNSKKIEKRTIYRVLQSSANELTQMISTLSESWKLEQIMPLDGTDGNYGHLIVVSQEITENVNGYSIDHTNNDKVKALSGSLNAHTRVR